MRRQRKCSECSKPLGNTLGKCREHGGENYRAGGTNMYGPMSRWWRLMLGVPTKKIDASFEESQQRREEALENSPRT